MLAYKLKAALVDLIENLCMDKLHMELIDYLNILVESRMTTVSTCAIRVLQHLSLIHRKDLIEKKVLVLISKLKRQKAELLRKSDRVKNPEDRHRGQDIARDD